MDDHLNLLPVRQFLVNEAESEAAIDADEARWDAQFAASQDGLQRMADKVRAEIQAGRTQTMVFTEDGRIMPE